MVQFPRYESYKNSGVEWLGEIPSHWEIIKLSHSFRLIGSGTTPKSGDLRYYQNGTIPWVNTGDLNDGILNVTSKRVTNQAIKHHSTLKIYPRGTVIIAMYGATIGKTSILNLESCANQACCALGNSIYHNNKFILYWLVGNRNNIISMSCGGGQPNISQETIKSLKIPAPKREEQQKIIDFLDRKTAEIDEAIAKKQKLIELLQEQKAILINRSVTKGLNPNVKMRDSGIDLIGEIPEHWKTYRLGFLANLLQTGPFGSQLHQDEYIEEGTPIINPSQIVHGKIIANNKITLSDEVVSRLSRHKLLEGDLVFGRRGEMGRCGLVDSNQSGWICGTGSILFRPRKDLIDSRFALIVFSSRFMKSILEYISIGATMENLNTSILSRVAIPLPPLIEQVKLIDKLSQITEQYNLLIEQKFQIKESLSEFKQVIISNAVTGKIKI